jgi:HlyD family secretion protein
MEKRLKKIITFVVIILVLAGLFAWRQVAQTAVDVWVFEVEKGLVELTVANTRAGTVKACRRSKLSMPIGGVVDSLLVEEGDRVAAGDLLLELWNQDRKAQVKQASFTLKSTEHQRKQACLLADNKQREALRIKTLAAKNLASEEAVDNAVTLAASQHSQCDSLRNEYSVAQARLDLAVAVLERTRLHAPFAGVIAEINGEVGEYVTPSPPGVATPPAVDLINYDCLYVTAPIDEVDAAYLKIGLPVKVTLDAFRDRNLTGEVVRIAPYVVDLEKQARTVDVDVRLNAPPEDIRLLVGYSTDTTIVLDKRDHVLRIPTESLINSEAVWVLNQTAGQLEKRNVTVGVSNWTYSEIIDGLAEGEWVVRNPDKPGIAEAVPAQRRESTLN